MLLALEQVRSSTDFRGVALILSCQTILYRVQPLEARSLQMKLGKIEVEGVVAEGVVVEEVERSGVEGVEGHMLEDIIRE
jgi:hypothetical protein